MFHMVKIEFYITDADMDRLWAVKDKSGHDDLNGNEYAKMLLCNTLHQLHPEKVACDD